MFIDLDAEFYVLKLSFEVFFPKIIREAGNREILILRVKSLWTAVTCTTLYGDPYKSLVRKRRKTRKSCVSWEKPVCDEHTAKITRCLKCME